MDFRIPFNRPCLAGNEYKYIAEAIANGQASGDGPFTRRCHELLERELQAPKVLLTTSCTHALEMAAILLDCGPGDEIIIPSFTFVSTANAFALRGARIVFADIRPDTLNLDESRLQSLITKRTKAIVPVHYAGVACEMDAICSLAREHGVRVVEDNAHGLFARYKGKLTGTFGCLSTQSFHETKNIICGEGGALVVNDPEMVERAMIIREKGTNRSQFFRGQVDKYTWVDIGSSYLPSDLLAAFLLAQLEGRQEIQTKRRRVWEYYWRHLQRPGPGKEGPAARDSRRVRAGLSHVLFDPSLARMPPGLDRALEGARDTERLSLRSPALVGNGNEIRSARVSRHRGPQFPAAQTAFL